MKDTDGWAGKQEPDLWGPENGIKDVRMFGVHPKDAGKPLKVRQLQWGV